MPSAPMDSKPEVENFIARWEKAEASERANYQMFLTELADLLGAPHPDPAGADNEFNAYVFDRAITRQKPDGTSTTVWADLYKRGCFILETKQGAHAPAAASVAEDPTPRAPSPAPHKTGHGIRGTRQWDIALEKAYNQARGYIRDLPSSEGRPPFLIVCDVGYVIELYSEFTCTGGSYIRFPDPKHHRIHLEDLRDPAIRQRLHSIWTDPLSLDPSKHAAKVTREVAEHLSALAKSLEADGHHAQAISTFLQRSLFTMFAEDVGLLPEGCYINVLERLKDAPEGFAITITNLWKDMANEEEWSVALMQKIAYFNGGLFENASALPCNVQQIGLLIGAAKPDWSDVEPAIFGTLLERALSPRERHKLGAHYTPRSYVERLVKPTVIDPLRSQWDAVKTAAAQFTEADQTDKAIAVVKDFHHELCGIKVLDPACGSGNFLYVTLEHMKRLEGEVLELLEALGDDELTFEMEAFKVRPSQFYGLELNSRAVAIAQLVLWIGYFQWHKKTTGTADTKDRPLLPKQQTILQQDAVLAYDAQTPRRRFVEAASSRSVETQQTKRQDAAATVEAASSRLSVAVKYAYYNPYKKVEISKASLPHWRQEDVTYFVTFRLADSLPQQKLNAWKAERDAWLAANPKPHSEEQKSDYFERFSSKMEAWLDAGHGDCILANPACKKIVEDAMRHFDGERYELGEHTVASNHVHALVTPKQGHELSGIVHSWKSYTANELNKHLGRSGQVWQKEYYDHILRTANAAYRIEEYIKRHDATVAAASSRLAETETNQTERQDAASTGHYEFVCIWDGRSTKPHPVTGKEVPDESVTIPVYDYSNPRRAEWPEADYIVGNPPFIGTSRMRDALGDGYTEALRKVWKKDVPESADFVMFWWEKAAELLRAKKIERFGFITTNSIHQTFNRRVLEKHLGDPKNPVSIAFAIPDHPWVDTVDGAAVRIAMTVATRDQSIGELNRVTNEIEIGDGEHAVDLRTQLGKIAANLKIGADVTSAVSLSGNQKISCPGVKLHGAGFIVTPEQAKELGLGRIEGLEKYIRGYRNGRDLTTMPREVMIIDLLGLTDKEVRETYPEVYQHVASSVKPERDQNKRETYKKYWWLFGEPRKDFRPALADLPRYITTVETSKHRFFQFLDQSVLPDNKLINFALADACHLAVLSSSIHVLWALNNGSRLGFGNDPVYVKTRCFETFPFPHLPEDSPLKARLRELGEQLDAHRKRQQAAHPELTMTGMYNVLEKLRREEPLTGKEKKIHDNGLVTLLKQIHDEIDTATAEAYGWSDLFADKPLADRLAQGEESLEQQILQRLVDLNHERAGEEAKGKIRYLRPEYQDPEFEKRKPESGNLKGEQEELPGTKAPQVSSLKPQPSAKQPWPKDLPSQVSALRTLLPETGPDPSALAAHFSKRSKKRIFEIDQILTTLKNLGQL